MTDMIAEDSITTEITHIEMASSKVLEEDDYPVGQEEEGYVQTAAYNYVSRKSFLHGANNIEIKGKTIIHDQCHLRGDLGHIRIGRYSHIGQGTILRPPSYQDTLQQIQFLPQTIGNHTRIGTNCVIEAAAIGSSVYMGNNCVIAKRVIIKDCCYIADGTVIPSDTVIPPFSRVGGCPGRIDLELDMPESVAVLYPDDCISLYEEFQQSLE